MADKRFRLLTLVAAQISIWCSANATPQLVVSVNDQASGYAGKMFVRNNPRPGSVSVLDFSTRPVGAWHLEGIQSSVIGPPSGVAISSTGNEILVSASMRVDPTNAGQLIPDNRLTRLRWSATTGLTHVSEIEVGRQPSGLALNRDGNRAWIALRAEGAVRLVEIENDSMRVAGKWAFASEQDLLSDLELSPDEKTAFATLHAIDTLLVLDVAESGALTERQRIKLPGGAYHVSFFPDGKRAVVGCTRASVLALLEEKDSHWAVRELVPTGRMPEGATVSPSGRWVASTCFDGANIIDQKSPWFGKPSGVHLYHVREDGALEKRQTLTLTGVLQGAAFTTDETRLVVGQFGPGNLRVFRLDGGSWVDDGTIEIPGQSSALTATHR